MDINPRYIALHRRFGRLVITPRKPGDLLAAYLKGKFDMDEPPPQWNPALYPRLCRCAISDYDTLRGFKTGINAGDLSFTRYRLIRNEKSARYFPARGSGACTEIDVIIESTTGYIQCNADKLFLELYLYLGIGKKDCHLGNLAYLSHLSGLQRYREGVSD